MATKKKAVAATAEEKAAKRKARMEALKNRPVEQRPNGKQMDVIDLGNGQVVKKYAAPVKLKGRSIGCLITTILFVKDTAVSVAEQFVPGEVVVKVKKGHGTLVAQKEKKDQSENEPEED